MSLLGQLINTHFKQWYRFLCAVKLVAHPLYSLRAHRGLRPDAVLYPRRPSRSTMSSVADIDTKNNETHEEGGNEGGGEEASPALNVINNIINPGGEDNIKGEEEDHAPNSLPRTVDADTYTYRDFAAIPAPQVGAAFHPPTLQAQKLPAKLASMLADPGKSSS